MATLYGWMIYPTSTTTNKFGNNAFQWMVTAAASYGLDLKVLLKEDLVVRASESGSQYEYLGESLETPNFVILRDYDYGLGTQLESVGIWVVNSTAAMFRSLDKGVTGALLQAKGIPTLDFLRAHQMPYEKVQAHFQGDPFVVKEIDGSQGSGVYLIESQQDFDTVQNQIPGPKLYQPFIASSFGQDVRVYVLGGKVIGAVRRISAGDFRSNYSLGGRVEAVTITPEIEHLAVGSAEALGLEFCGVDLLQGEQGYLVCEVNGNAGFRTLTAVSEVDVAQELLGYIHRGIQGK